MHKATKRVKLKDFEQTTGQKVVTGDNFLPQSKKPKQIKKKD